MSGYFSKRQLTYWGIRKLQPTSVFILQHLPLGGSNWWTLIFQIMGGLKQLKAGLNQVIMVALPK